jgi:KaiC/GvpD/RAD55 family RecA-like ATPase
MLEAHCGIKVVDDALNKIRKKRCSVLVIGRNAAETFVFQLTRSVCKKDSNESSDKSKKIQTIYVNFTDSEENRRAKAKRVKWNLEEEKLTDIIDMYDRRSVGSIDNVVKEISDKIDNAKGHSSAAPSKKEVIVIVNSLSRLALYLGEEKVLDFLITMNFLGSHDTLIHIFYYLDDSLHEPLFIDRVKSLVDCAIIFREDYEMEIRENFFGLQGFGESATVTRWYPCLDIREYGIVPMDYLEVRKYEDSPESNNSPESEKTLIKDEEIERRIRVAEARMRVEYCKEESLLNDEDQKNYKTLYENEEKLCKWLKKQEEILIAQRENFRSGIWTIDRIFSEKDNILGGLEHYYGIAIYFDVPPIDMHPVFGKILHQCLEDNKPFIEISIDDTPNVFLNSLKEAHSMNTEYEKIKDALLEDEHPRLKFINSYGIEPSGELVGSENIINIDNPYNVTIMFAKYRKARELLNKAMRSEQTSASSAEPEERETGPVIWLNSYSGLAAVTSVDNAYSFGVNAIMAQDVWSPKDEWKSLMLFSLQKYFLSEEDDMNLLQVLDGIIEFSCRRVLGNRMYYFRVPKMPKTNKTVGWTPYKIMKERLGFLPLDEDTVYHYLKAKVLRIRGRQDHE